jgi:hypothetical protein
LPGGEVRGATVLNLEPRSVDWRRPFPPEASPIGTRILANLLADLKEAHNIVVTRGDYTAARRNAATWPDLINRIADTVPLVVPGTISNLRNMALTVQAANRSTTDKWSSEQWDRQMVQVYNSLAMGRFWDTY